MKKIITALCLLYTVTSSAQKAEKVYGPARVHKSIEYYKEQSALWKKEIDKDPKNGDAWYNYFNANRILYFNDKADTRSGAEKDKVLSDIADQMEKAIPNSYEANLCRYMSSDFSEKYVPYLKKAAALDPERTEHVDYMINVSELSRNIPDRDIYTKRKNEIGEMSAGMLYYNYNVLMGLPKNSILITSGDNDTYPAWTLQGMGIRKDVTVINLYLISMDDYRSRVFNELGVAKMDRKKDVPSDTNFNREILKRLASNSKGYPVSIALSATSCQQLTELVENDLYLTGLAYQYDTESVDNMAIMKKNFEQIYALDYIDKPFYTDISPEKVGMMNLNYLIPMLKLYDHYKLSGDELKRTWIKNKIELIAKDSPEAEEVKKYIAAQ